MVIQGDTLEQTARALLKQRGVEIKDIAELVMFLQEKYVDQLDMETCIENVEAVLTKREVHNTIITGIQLDILAGGREAVTAASTDIK